MKPLQLLQKNFICFLIVGIFFLEACAFQEVTQNFDTVFGSNYTPPLRVYTQIYPQKVLLLPVTGPVDEADKAAFLNEFLRAWQATSRGTQIVDSSDIIYQYGTSWTKENCVAMARAKGCDAFLLMNMERAAVYEPLRITVDVAMEAVDPRTPILDGELDYDSRNVQVANSARRFYQHEQHLSVAPDRSINVLENRTFYNQFAASHAANWIKKILETNKKT